jgi:hypothetical protein
LISVLSSNLWFWYLQATSDCRHLGNRDIETFPFNPQELNATIRDKLSKIGREYAISIKKCSQKTVRVYKKKKAVECISFSINRSKSIIDKIDHILANYYEFTKNEIDFIINYDIKYRMRQ